jgi:Transglutaminase-like superfamily
MNSCHSCYRASGEHAARLASFCLVLGLLAPGCDRPLDKTAAPPVESTWDACYVHGEKVGHIETTIQKTQHGTRQLLEIATHSEIGFRRFGDANQMDIRTTSVETPAGEVRQFTVTTKMGGDPISIQGEVVGHELQLKIQQAGKTETSSMPWQIETKGFQGIEQSLERAPMQPGEARHLALLVPVANQVTVAEVELQAQQLESTKLLDGSRELLRIDCQLTPLGVKGKGIQTVLWTDEQGKTIKTFVPGIEQEGFRTTRELALESPQTAAFDLETAMIVKVDRSLPPPAQTRRIRYRIELADDDPAALFPETPNQQVKKTGQNTAEITITAPHYDGATATDGAAKDSLPTPDDLSPSSMLQSDDPTIVAMARKARGKAEDPLATARALEGFVHRTVSNKNFSQAFATALEVAKSREGDCTEHAMLLTALARACQIPARVVVGLVYVPSKQGFGYHMWSEIFDGRQWLPLDATLGQGGIGASHLELGDSNLKDATALTSLISVVQVLGKLKIEVLEVE